jgi:BirA family biotin operon repressor/biotin-[acetyl-CoA-carboxylase] ligase
LKIEKFDSLESTNKYCEALDLAEVEDFTCYWALEQTAGIGQRGNRWESESGKNLTFSLVLHPTFLPADCQFKLTESLSLALADFLSSSPFHLSPSVKWPNDIYARMSSTIEGSEKRPCRKICGTLVSARIKGTQIASAICGIGLNVNQTLFPNWVPNPTSLALLTGKEYNPGFLLQQLLDRIEKRYSDLKNGLNPGPEYLDRLLNLGVPARYIYNEEELTATITGVDPHGRLLLTSSDGRRLSCGMKEISFLL